MYYYSHNVNMSNSVDLTKDETFENEEEEFDPTPSPKRAEYIHNNDYALQLQRQEWEQDEALKARIRYNDKMAKQEKRKLAKKKKEEKERMELQKKFMVAKAKMQSGLSLTQATEPSPESSPVKPPPKKKKSVTFSAKKTKMPEQKNKVTSYFSPSSSTEATSEYPVFNTAPDVVGAYRESTPLRTTTVRVTPYAKMTTKSIYSGNTIHSKDLNSDGSQVDMDRICSGCHNPFRLCMERKWRNVCLHRVVDYFEDNDFENLTRTGVYDAYYDAFLVMIKAEILSRSEFWECGGRMVVPDCMKTGSLEDAFDMLKLEDSLTYQYFTTRRVVDVQRHMNCLEGVFNGHCKEGEKIVRVTNEDPF